MKITTWNVNGIRARGLQVREWMEQTRPDVVCLQEIKASPDQVPTLVCELDSYWYYWHGGAGGYSGVGLHVSKAICPERPQFSHPEFDFENRIVTVQIGHLTVASVYVPNGGKDFAAKIRFVNALDAFAATFAAVNAPLVLCGDLNIARLEIDVHQKERNPRVTGQTPEERALFEQILGKGLVDVGRALHPDEEGIYSWWAPWRNMRAKNLGWRIDYILASTALAETASSCGVEAAVGTSDHAPVTAVFDTSALANGWR